MTPPYPALIAGHVSDQELVALFRSALALVFPSIHEDFGICFGDYPTDLTAGAIICIRDPNRSMSAIATLRALFRFTPTEARIAQALANGKTIAEIASAHRAKLQAVREQLKLIFAKTGMNRQAQCIAAMPRRVATLVRE